MINKEQVKVIKLEDYNRANGRVATIKPIRSYPAKIAPFFKSPIAVDRRKLPRVSGMVFRYYVLSFNTLYLIFDKE